MAVDWRITAQNQTTTLMEGGRFVETMEVAFTTVPEGINGTVNVPLNQYTADYVRQLIDSRVEAIKEVQEL